MLRIVEIFKLKKNKWKKLWLNIFFWMYKNILKFVEIKIRNWLNYSTDMCQSSPNFDLKNMIWTYIQRSRKKMTQICQILKNFFFSNYQIFFNDKFQAGSQESRRIIFCFFFLVWYLICSQIWLNYFLGWLPLWLYNKIVKTGKPCWCGGDAKGGVLAKPTDTIMGF
jgi:hypothetical protein